MAGDQTHELPLKRQMLLPLGHCGSPNKLKAFADDKLNVTKIVIFVSDRVKNIMRKGENAGYQRFLFFSQCFHNVFKGFFQQGRKQ